jgi:hypothetical protein
MKSKLPDSQIKTSCKNCLCSIYEGKTQTGCSFNRIEKFKESVLEAYDDEKEFYVIERFCNYYRNPKWNGGTLDIEKIKSESAISFDVIIDCNNLDTDIDTDNLISILNNLNYYSNKINVVLAHSHLSSRDIRKNVFKIFCATKCTISEAIDLNEYVHNMIWSSNSTYHIIVDISNKSELSQLYKLNGIINDDIKQATLFNLSTSKVISNMVYKIESSINNETNYEKIVQGVIKKSLESNLSIDIS